MRDIFVFPHFTIAEHLFLFSLGPFNPFLLSQRTTKPATRLVRPAKAQIRLRIREVWSESSLNACAFLCLPAIQREINDNPCHTGWMYRLIWVFACHTGLLVTQVCWSHRSAGHTSCALALILKRVLLKPMLGGLLSYEESQGNRGSDFHYFIYSRPSLSRSRLSRITANRITAYIEVKFWSLF